MMRSACLETMRAALLALALVGGCSSTSSKEPPVACEELQAAARAKVEQAFTSNLACQVDSDCVELAFQASCFDSCTGVVAKTGTAAVQAAINTVEANQCAETRDAGCNVVIPPCVPRTRIACTGGVCM
jgi:hypothetical protein